MREVLDPAYDFELLNLARCAAVKRYPSGTIGTIRFFLLPVASFPLINVLNVAQRLNGLNGAKRLNVLNDLNRLQY